MKAARRQQQELMLYGSETGGESLRDPLDTVTAQDRFALITVTIRGTPYVIVDIAMRMLVARELFNAQGFPPEYVIDPWMEAHWRHESDGDVWVREGHLCGTSQVRCCGNSVCPLLAAEVVRAQFSPHQERRAA